MSTPAARPAARLLNRWSPGRRVAVASALTAALAASAVAPTFAGTDETSAATTSGRDRDDDRYDDRHDERLDLDSLTIPDAQERMEEGSLTSAELTEAYLTRILLLDPKLNSIIDIDHQALGAARASDEHREHEGPRSELEGIPVLLKDNIDAEGFATTAGSRALTGTLPDDAVLTERLRAAGAIILGKTNLTEWANFRGNGSTSGWSGLGGQTNNPYVLDRNPCGSSSGSGVAAAAALAQVTIGTETNGSIVCPAGQNGVVGLKPTLGLVSRTGIIPISAEQDTAGPMARHVVDVAITTAVIQGTDVDDAATREIPDGQPQDYLELLDDESLEGARVGVWRPYELGRLDGNEPPENWTEEDEAGLEAVEEVVADTRAALEEAGAAVVEVELPTQAEIDGVTFGLLKAEFARDLPAYLGSTPGTHPRTLQGLIDFNTADAEAELWPFGQEIFTDTAALPPQPTPETVALREHTRRLARESIDETLAKHGLDAIVAPTNSAAWRTTYLNGEGGEDDRFVFGSSSPAAVAGYPNITVPAGFVGELPIGVSFFGTRWDEADLLSYAYDFEDETEARERPRFIPSIDDDEDD